MNDLATTIYEALQAGRTVTFEPVDRERFRLTVGGADELKNNDELMAHPGKISETVLILTLLDRQADQQPVSLK